MRWQYRSSCSLTRWLKLLNHMECVRWVCEDALWEHEWVTELNVVLKENEILKALNYDFDVPNSIMWGLLWFSSPWRLNQKIHKQWHESRKVPCSGWHGDWNHVHNDICRIAHATNLSSEVYWCGSVQVTWQRLELKRRRRLGFGWISALAAPRQCQWRRPFWFVKMQQGSPDDAAPLFKRCVLCSPVWLIPIPLKTKLWALQGLVWGQTPREAPRRMSQEGMFWNLFQKVSLECLPNLLALTMRVRGGWTTELPFPSPHDPATLGTGSHSDLPEVPNRRNSAFNRSPLWTQWRFHRAGPPSFSDAYFCHSSNESFHTSSSNSVRMSLCCHYLAQTDVSTQTLCSAFIFSRKNHSATKFITPSICGFEYKAVTVTDIHLHLVFRIFSSWSTHSTLLVPHYSLLLQGPCPDSTS